MMKKILTGAMALLTLQIYSQDTLKIMTHNILKYSTSHYATRYNDFKEILMHVQPDIVICQEVEESAAAQLLLDNAFTPAGIGPFTRATFVDGPDTDNSLFFNTSKVKFKSQTQISTGLRNITHYKLYTLISAGDTAWINLFSLHLKASTGFENERLLECKDLCTYMASLSSTQNIIVGGDFNFYSNITETGFNWLTVSGCSHLLYDPINRPGDWNNNTSFKDIHTQSTRTSNEPDGGSTGGMDDRFDFMLVNYPVLAGTSKVRYVPGSYTVVGQDGNHFNAAINAAPTNTAVPVSVANALYNMSDHLPTTMQVAIGNEVGLSEFGTNYNGTSVVWVNDGNGVENHFLINSTTSTKASVRVFDLTGRAITQKEMVLVPGSNLLALPAMPSRGEYLLQVQTERGWTGCKFLSFQ